MEVMQTDLDSWIEYHNNGRTHPGKMCCGRTPIERFEEGKLISEEEIIQDGDVIKLISVISGG